LRRPLPISSRRFRNFALFICASLIAIACLAEQTRPLLTTLAAIHALSNQEAERSLPVAFEGIVTYYEKGNIDLFVQDGDTAIYVEAIPGLSLAVGDRVRVEGTTRASFLPEILARGVTLLHHGAPPPPVRAEFGQMIRAELDCRRATVQAVVRAANVFSDGASKSVFLDLLMPGGNLQAQIVGQATPAQIEALLDSTIEVTGAVAGRFDSKNQMTGILLEVPSFSDVRVVAPARVAPHELPFKPFNKILESARVEDRTDRVRVQGTITYYQPGSALVLQDGLHALWVDTRSEEPHNTGDHAMVSGFPDVRNGAVVLTGAEIVSVPSELPPHVEDLNITQLASGTHAFELVSVEGQLLTQVRERAQDQYVVVAQGHVFSAIYRHPERGLNIPLAPMKEVRLGSRVRVTGICVLDRGDQFRGAVAFHLLLRSSSDVTVIAGPSIVSVRNLGILLGVLLMIVFAAIGRAWLLDRKLHRREIAVSATVERWRTRVIDGINSAVPLSETLLQITELLSFKLQVEYAWTEIDGGGTFGNPVPAGDPNMQVVEKIITAHSGTALGKICIAYQAAPGRRRVAIDALENASRLAALAIETGGKYSDLVRRSELDPLTKARNRFGFDRTLAVAIENARKHDGRCGLIYIDLDEFKKVNDDFGHLIGDRYLQEVAARLARQLRPHDTLARVGGDEFSVIIESVGSRAEVQEIALRLQDCFRTEFALDKYVVPGSASIGFALYPDDAGDGEALLDWADAGMYAAKRQKREEGLSPADQLSETLRHDRRS
jgi:diguanylate cyclase (GGDEF)-like protein